MWTFVSVTYRATRSALHASTRSAAASSDVNEIPTLTTWTRVSGALRRGADAVVSPPASVRSGCVAATRRIISERARPPEWAERIPELLGGGFASRCWPLPRHPQGIRAIADSLGASAVALHLPDEGQGVANRFTEGFDEAGPELLRARYGVLPERPGDTHIELGWSDGRTSVDRDTEIAIELLCDHLSIALERLEGGGEPSILAKVVNLRG
jgi:hypothetical protein